MKALRLVLLLVVVALAPAVAWAGAGDGLLGTAHDFSGKTATSNGEPWTTGLCTICHTPHKAISTALLWNHTLSLNPTFSWSDATTTTAGTPLATFPNTYSGPTAKCLSCHDGSVAIGNIAWFGEGKPTSITDLSDMFHPTGDTYNVGFGGDMKGNHPVAMPYPYLGAANTYNGITTSSLANPGYGIVASEWQSTPLAPIRMFNDSTGSVTPGPVAGRTGIECSSCHDPHNKAAVDDLFLRGKLGGSDTGYICLKCHIK